MTKEQFDKTKCGDLAYVCFRKEPSGAIIEKINRTRKTIKIFGERKMYHYTKVNKGLHKDCRNFWGYCGSRDLVEMLEFNK
jgi:hypothetical protein